jgi:hypothetical protein
VVVPAVAPLEMLVPEVLECNLQSQELLHIMVAVAAVAFTQQVVV